jgi:hypothetical protein
VSLSTVILLFACIIGFLLFLFCWNPGIGGQNLYHYKAYLSFQKEWKDIAAYLPENATDISHYCVLDFDTNYHYLEASAQLNNIEDFTVSRKYFGYSSHYLNISYSDSAFKRLFYNIPDWWNQESLSGYQENCLILGPDANNYGKGIWLFYNNDNQKIRVFTWSQQWLSSDKVKKDLIQN